MIGPEGVARLLTQRLRETVPAKVTELQNRYSVTARELPGPSTDCIYPTVRDVVAIGKFPCMMVSVVDNVGRAAVTRLTEATGEFDEYEYRYRVRIFQYVTGDDYEPTALERMRLMLAVREVLLYNKIMGPLNGDTVTIDDLSFRESFDEGLATINTSKLMGASMMELEIKTVERLYQTPGDQTTLTIDVDHLPPVHPHETE